MKKTETNKNEKQKKIKDISLVKIGSVTAEIFQIWANVARTNVAWNLRLKFDQNRANNS